MTAIVADDSKYYREVISSILNKNGVTIVGLVDNGLDAVNEALNQKPDIIVMDITMPEMDGLQALQRIYSRDKSIKVIICTSMDSSNLTVEAIQRGAKGFVLKHYLPDSLLDALERIIA